MIIDKRKLQLAAMGKPEGYIQDVMSFAKNETSTHITLEEKDYLALVEKYKKGPACAYLSDDYCKRFKRKITLKGCKGCPKNTTKGVWPLSLDVMSEEARIHAQKKKRILSHREKLGAIIPIIQAKATGKTISLEQIERRMDVCSNCELVTTDAAGNVVCGVCGCHLTHEKGFLPDMIALEESEISGCKHPKGSQWRAAGC